MAALLLSFAGAGLGSTLLGPLGDVAGRISDSTLGGDGRRAAWWPAHDGAAVAKA